MKSQLIFHKVGGYKFNEDCLSNNILSKVLIYGRNATGKSNLGLALFDITKNLSSRPLMMIKILHLF